MVDKETAPLFKGYNYPSGTVARCPRYHRCLVSNKCQSYDPHQPDCAVCETRVSPPLDKIGGVIPEGKYIPDIQDCVHTIEKIKLMAFAHRDSKGQTLESSVDISENWDRMRRATDMMKMFMDEGAMKLEEKTVNALYDVEKKKLLGRLD